MSNTKAKPMFTAEHTHNIYHDTDYQCSVDVHELCDFAHDARMYVATERDFRGNVTRRQEWTCANYIDMSFARDACATATKWMNEKRLAARV